MLRGWGVKAGMARVWWQIKLFEPLYNACLMSALEAMLLRLSAIQIHVYVIHFTYFPSSSSGGAVFDVPTDWYAD